jgi:hypothetical protein
MPLVQDKHLIPTTACVISQTRAWVVRKVIHVLPRGLVGETIAPALTGPNQEESRYLFENA